MGAALACFLSKLVCEVRGLTVSRKRNAGEDNRPQPANRRAGVCLFGVTLYSGRTRLMNNDTLRRWGPVGYLALKYS